MTRDSERPGRQDRTPSRLGQTGTASAAVLGFGSRDPSLIAAIEAASAGSDAGPRTPAERSRVLHEVFISSNEDWLRPFAVMLAISAGIAALGLTQDSAAVIIGAMIIAPLGAPMVALGGAFALGWLGQALRMFLVIVVGSILVVAIAFIIGLTLPPMTPTAEMLARTDPDLRDLAVALLAGAAGAYARTRTELISVLAGVAIAVALVPPLATVGLLLEDGRPVLAQGALLLLAANLVGIAAAAAVVMIVTGYAPRPSIPRTTPGIAVGLVALLAVVVVVVPLSGEYSRLSTEAIRLADVNRIVASAIGPGTAAVVAGVSVDGNQINVDISAAGSNIDPQQLQQRIQAALGPDAVVTVSLV